MLPLPLPSLNVGKRRTLSGKACLAVPSTTIPVAQPLGKEMRRDLDGTPLPLSPFIKISCYTYKEELKTKTKTEAAVTRFRPGRRTGRTSPGPNRRGWCQRSKLVSYSFMQRTECPYAWLLHSEKSTDELPYLLTPRIAANIVLGP